jgi:hypothetical protein
MQMVSGNRYELKLRSDAREGARPTQEQWIEDEGCRRTYYAVYIFFGMLTLTYNHTPAISFNEFDSLELPSSESLWTLEISDQDSWRDSWSASTIITVREAHDSLFREEAVRYSAFATRVMINALFLEVWYHKRSFEALQDIVTEYKLRLALETWEKSLEMCEPETIVVQLNAPHKGHPLIFNAMAVYRNTRARLEVDLKSVQEALRYHDSYEVAAAMSTARDQVKRSPEMIKVIQECFNCIEIVALQGIKWVGRTCATNWSVEHPLSGLDLMVILSLWLYRLEHDEEPADEEELAMYNKVRNLFDDDSVDIYGSKLSSTVARLWGTMLEEVVVWGSAVFSFRHRDDHTNRILESPNSWGNPSSSIPKLLWVTRMPSCPGLVRPRRRRLPPAWRSIWETVSDVIHLSPATNIVACLPPPTPEWVGWRLDHRDQQSRTSIPASPIRLQTDHHPRHTAYQHTRDGKSPLLFCPYHQLAIPALRDTLFPYEKSLPTPLARLFPYLGGDAMVCSPVWFCLFCDTSVCIGRTVAGEQVWEPRSGGVIGAGEQSRVFSLCHHDG